MMPQSSRLTRRLATLSVSALGAPVLLAASLSAQEVAEAERNPDVVFVATPTEVVMTMLNLAGVSDTDVVYDLGSGDGRIVIAAARHYSARGIGVDIDPIRVAEGRQNADSAGVRKRVELRQADFFKTDLRPASVVTLYLSRIINEQLRPKFFRELRPGSRIVSQAFDMGDWQPDSLVMARGRNFGETPVHLWVVPARVAGRWQLTLDAENAPPERLRLELTQRYQVVRGRTSVGGSSLPLDSVRLRGDGIEFTIGRRRFTGRTSSGTAEGTVTTDGKAAGRWRASRR